MGIFDILINVVESLLLAFFIFWYYKIKIKKDFILLTAIFVIAEMLGNSTPVFAKLILVIMPLILVVFQYIKFKRISINHILIAVLSILILQFCNMLAIFVFRIIFSLTLTPDTMKIVIIFSKCLAFVIFYYFPKIIDIGTVELSKLWQFNTGIILLIIMMDFEITAIVSGGVDNVYTYLRILLTLLLIGLLYNFLSQFIFEATTRLEYEMQLQKIEYEKKNADIINRNKEEILGLQHNLKYILMNILLYAKNNDVRAIEELSNSYLGRVVVADHSIATNNYYFDFMFNQVSVEFKSNRINLKKSITISKESYINSEIITAKVVEILKQFLNLSIDNNIKDLEIEITEDYEWCLIRFIIPCLSDNELDEYINEHFNLSMYNIYFDDKYKLLRVSIIVEYNNNIENKA